MLSNPSHWCVITYHKENYSLLPAFMNYYRNYFGIRRALIFCGRTQNRSHDSIKQLLAAKLNVPVPASNRVYATKENRELTVSEFVDGEFVLWVASYVTHEHSPYSEFNKIKADVTPWGETFLPPEITKTLVVDADEFLYVKNPGIFESVDSLGFHFVDMVPSSVWPPQEMTFSLQGWYYQRQAQPIFKYGTKLSLLISQAVGRGLTHSGCKTYYFDRKHMATGTPWHHGTAASLSCCFALNRYLKQPDFCLEILKNTSCCYHLAMTCKEFFLGEKLRLFNRVQTDPKNGMDQYEQLGAEARDIRKAGSTFEKSIKNSLFPVVKDNFLLPYLQISHV